MDGESLSVIKLHLRQILNVGEDNVDMTTRIKEDLGATSLDVVELAATLGHYFCCEISDDEVEEAQTVGDLLQVIERSTAKAEAVKRTEG